MTLVVRDLMAKEVRTVEPDMSVAELERELIARRVSGFPVVDGDRLVGVVSRSDIVRAIVVEHSFDAQLSDYYQVLTPVPEPDPDGAASAIGARVGARIEGMKVGDVMSRTVLTVAPSLSIAEFAGFLIEHDVHRAPVVEDGRLVGIATSLDIVRLVFEGGLS